MKYQPELGIMGNLQRIMTELKKQNNKSIIMNSNVLEVKASDEKNRADIDYISMMTDIPLEAEE